MLRLDQLTSDLRVAARGLRRSAAFTFIACLTLALGIGANVAIFSAINAVLLEPLPFATADELVLVNVAPAPGGGTPGSMSYPDIADLRDDGRAFRSLIGINGANMTLTGAGSPAIVEVNRVTEGLLETFGAAPTLGRDIRREEFGDGGPQVVVIGHAMWQDRFGGASDVLGRSLTLNGSNYEIVGVAPPGFEFPSGVSMWIPRALSLDGCGRGCHTMQVIGRLAPGVSLAQAAGELEQFGLSLERAYPATNTGKRFVARDLKTAVVGDVRAGLWITFAAATLVLLITCANVANLLIARASAREGEVAVRAALGASRGRLAAQVLSESALISAIGGGAGVALAYGGVAVLRRLASGTVPRADLIVIDGTVLLVTVGALAVVMLLFGSVPAWSASRAALAGGLARIGRGAGSGTATMRLRRVVLAGEVALSAGLLVGAGLLLRTSAELHAVNVGFETRDVSRFSVVLPELSYPELERASLFYAQLEARLAALPGVEAVGAMFGQPLGRGNATGDVLVTGRPEPQPGENAEASVRSVTPGLLPALRIPLVRGRLLEPADNRPDAQPVALVNEGFVRRFFPDEDPIGKEVRLTVDFGYGSPAWRIVGVVGDVRFASITREAEADLYVPHGQYGPLSAAVHVRTAPGAPPLMQDVRSIVSALDPNVPVYRVETLSGVMRTATAPTRLYLSLVGLFAVIAAALAAIGLYGVVSYLVVQRRREIGIRVALGSQRRGIVALVVRQGMQPVVIGLGVGVLAALASGQFVQSVLFGVAPYDPVVLGAATAVMAIVALGATVVPALRASDVEPAEVLHGE